MKRLFLTLNLFLFLSCNDEKITPPFEQNIDNIDRGANTDTLYEQGLWLDSTQSIGTKTAVQVITTH